MMELQQLLPEYQRHLKSLAHRQRGIDHYVQHLRGFLDELPERAGPEALTPAAVRRHMRARAETCKPATVLGMLTAVRSFCKFLMEEELLDADPTTRLRWPRRTTRLPRALTPPELNALLTAIKEPEDLPIYRSWHWRRNRRAIFLMLYAGLRLSEAAALLWRDVDLQAGTLLVREGKGGKDRLLPLHPRLKAELRPLIGSPPEYAVAGKIDGTAMSGKALAHLFEVWLRRQGIEDVHAHRLRHTFATEMLRGGAALPDIQRAMGHADLGTTQVYLRIDLERVTAAVGCLPVWD